MRVVSLKAGDETWEFLCDKNVVTQAPLKFYGKCTHDKKLPVLKFALDAVNVAWIGENNEPLSPYGLSQALNMIHDRSLIAALQMFDLLPDSYQKILRQK